MRSSISWVLMGLAGCAAGPQVATPEPDSPVVLNPDVVDVAYPGGTSHYVSIATEVYSAPMLTPRIADPFVAGRTITNAKGIMPRGLTVAVMEERGEWVRIVTDDGLNGWLPMRVLVDRANVHEATVLADTPARQGPQSPDTFTVLAGTLLLIVDGEGDYSKVTLDTGESFWVQSEALITDSEELSTSRAINGVRWSKRNRDVAAPYYTTWSRTRANHPGAKLLATLSKESGYN